ncbi:MAG: hypothetical protein SH809_01900 [Rhodothermales bacterium]|nr:hypothetical protein [Rhodothermales bacterium]
MLNAQNPRPAIGRLFPVPAASSVRHLLQEPALFYHPPYETEAEDDLAYQLVGTLAETAGLHYQARMGTSYASFEVTFLVEYGRQRMGLQVTRSSEGEDEVDAAFHDTLLVDAGLVDILYRIDEADLQHRLFDTLCLIARWNPGLFSDRGLAKIEAQASPAARAFYPTPGQESGPIALILPPEEDGWIGEAFIWPSEEAGDRLTVRRMSRYHPAGWMREVDEALAHVGITVGQLRGHWAKTA